ncbi:DUF1102 domain-containing protein [Halorubrum distributum]|jgi:hypothetical protein|uniref:DUF1102 domain-containing protein n=1 Tax=Halorubrum distributum TaxID=29283 RepID=A0A6B1IZM4_9EURY|nr:DUF1102 domain-containing protein [Halorubrum terrestre]MYL68825.1 DUF1102 domain-containing protein [Halorubrum terrestre]
MKEVKRPARDGPRKLGRGHTTMERRKFVVGLGALASGSAAAVGTGAFTSVTANRSVDVEVAGDANAYLSLQQISGSPNSQQYVTNSSGEIGFDFSDSNGDINGNGNGFNPDAVTEVDRLLRVANQGTQDVDVSVDLSSLSTGSADVSIFADGNSSNSEYTGSGTDISNTSVTLAPGDSMVLNLEVDTNGQDPVSTSGTITFNADASS